MEPSLKFPIDETKPKTTADEAFEEKDVSSILAHFQNTDYQAFDSRNKYKSCVLFFWATGEETLIGKLLEEIKPVVTRKKRV